MYYLRWFLLPIFALTALTVPGSSHAQPLDKRDMIKHVKRALQPVATTSYDSNYNAHYAGLTVAREDVKQIDTTALPAAEVVVENWTSYEHTIKRGFENRAAITVDVFQIYTSATRDDRHKTAFSKALTQELLTNGRFRVVALNRFSSDSLTIGKAVSQAQDFFAFSGWTTPPGRARVADMLSSIDPAIAYYSNNKDRVQLVGTSRPEITDLRNQFITNKDKLSSLDRFALKSALTKLKAEMALAETINGAVRNNVNRVALVIHGSAGKSIYQIANKRGYQTRFFWATKRTKAIEQTFSLK